MYGGSERGDIYGLGGLKVPQLSRYFNSHLWTVLVETSNDKHLPSLFLLVLYVLMAFIFNGMAAIRNILV
jgi:hypothetical protein